MRNSIAFFAKVSLTLLVLGLIVPVQTASSDTLPTVTKTFTVHDRNDQPLAGARVQMRYFDGSINPNDFTYTTIVVTDSFGIATVSLPKNEQSVGAQVEPSLGDTTNAVYTSIPYGTGALDSLVDSPIAVRLQAANLSLRIVQSDNSDAPLTTNFDYPFPINDYPSRNSWVLRAGSFGVALDPTLAIGSSYVVDASPPLGAVNGFPRYYGLKVTGVSPNLAPVLYTDVLDGTPLIADSSGTYTLMLDTENIVGQLKTVGGTDFILPTGLGQGYLQIQKLNLDGSFDYSSSTNFLGASSFSQIDLTGHFNARIRGLLAGRYEVIVNPGASPTIPAFRSDLWVNASGGFSLTENGTYSSSSTAPFTLNLTVPTANLVIHTVQAGTNIADPSSLVISQTGSGTFINSDFSKSVGSFAMPDGNFVLTDYSAAGGNPGIYDLSVLHSVATLTDSAHHTLMPASDGSYSISIPAPIPPNVLFEVVDSTTALAIPGAYLSFCLFVNNQTTTCSGSNPTDQSGNASTYLTDGSYKVTVNPGPNSSLTYRVYDATVSGGGTIINIVGATLVSGRWILNPANPNFLFHLQDLSGNAVPNQFVNACPLDSNLNCANGAVGPNSTSDGSGNGGLYFDNGSFQIFIYPAFNSALAQVSYRVTVAGGAVTAIDPAVTADGSGRNSLVIPTANLHLKLVNPTNTNLPLTDGYVFVCNGHPGQCPSVGSNPGSIANFYLADGNYSLGVMDFTPNTTFVQNTYQVSVLHGVISFVGQTPIIDSVTNRFLVSPSSSNVLFQVQDPNTAAAILGAYLSFCLFVNNQTTTCSGSSSTDQMGNAAAYLTDGSYKVTVNPGPNSSLSSRVYDATVSGGGTTVNIAGSTLVSGRWVVTPAQPNVSGTFVDEFSHPLVFSGNRGVSIQLQKQDTNQNWIYQNNNAWRANSTWGLNLSAAGTYRVAATPYGFSDYATTFSDPFVFDPAVVQSGIPIVFRTSNLKLLIHNPLDNSLLRGGFVQIEQLLSDRSTWISSPNIDSGNPGIASASLGDGNYRITVVPPQGSDSIVGLAQKVYLVTVSISTTGTTVVVTDGTTLVSADPTTQRFPLYAASANITARVVDSMGAPITLTSGVSISVNVQKWNSANSNWEYSPLWSQTNNDGFVGISIHEAGKYRLRLNPYGRDDLVPTVSSDFTITSSDSSTFTKNFGDIPLGKPSIMVKVVLPGSGQTVSTGGVEIRKNGRWLDWANPGSNGIVPIALTDAGTFELVVHPAWDGSTGQATAKSYAVTAVKDSSTGAVTASADGITAINGVFSLPLGTATLNGTVQDPLGHPLANSQVVAVDAVSNEELWQNSVSSDQNGAWAMSLPAGSYKLSAKAPWGNSLFGSSDLLGDFTVDANGLATALPSGLSASTVALTLKNPTWSGVVESPDGSQVIARANICYRINSSAEVTCSATDVLGKFAIAAPSGFSAFDASSFLEIQEGSNPQYSHLHLQGASAVLAALGLSGTSIVLKLPVPNVAVTVTAGGVPVANAWVSFERDGVGWLAGGMTDAQGVARSTIPNPDQGFSARAEVNGSSFADAYAPTRAVFPAATLTGGVYIGQLSLSTPNLRGILREPSSSGAVIVPFANIYLFDDSNGAFIASDNADSTGFFSLNAPAPSSGIANYTLTVNPPWNGVSTNAPQKYEITVDVSGNVAATLKSSGVSVPTETRDGVTGTIYSFGLSAPSVAGIVYGSNGSTPIANSWITVTSVSTGQYVNIDGGNSRHNGGFSLLLSDGTYDLQAGAPRGSINISNSAPCRVVVSGLQVTSAPSACVQSDKTIHLALRAPNLTFTVVDGNGQPVPYASANIWTGSWHAWAQSDQNGQVSLFVDSDAIKAATAATDGSSITLHIVVDPPYGDSSSTRWQCDSNQLASNCLNMPNVTIGQAYPSTSLGSLSFSTPNVKLRVLLPDASTPVGAGGWVNIYQILDLAHPNNKNWLGGAPTDAQGYAAFNIDSTLTNLVVEVNPPSAKRNTVSFVTYTNNLSGYSATEINNASFNLGLPNLKVTVRGAAGEVNKWGGITIEKRESDNTYTWINSFNLDEFGRESLLLPSNGTFRITLGVGTGSSGAQTTCIVNTSSSGTVSTNLTNCPDGLLTLDSMAVRLASGNVVGTVIAPDSTPVAGATVYANVHNAVSDLTAVITTTTASGRFGLNLDPTLQWDLRIFPPQAGAGQVQLAKILSGPTVPIHSDGLVSDLGSIALSVL